MLERIANAAIAWVQAVDTTDEAFAARDPDYNAALNYETMLRIELRALVQRYLEEQCAGSSSPTSTTTC